MRRALLGRRLGRGDPAGGEALMDLTTEVFVVFELALVCVILAVQAGSRF
ncbi:MAG TPA: hypothetical protein VHZ81_05685 [Galbitalea sp.]|nr:hypothetical protein [Galbitalea sp.]